MALWINNINKSTQLFIPRSSPDGPWINHPPIQDQAPKALEELPPIQDQAPTALEESTIVHHPFILRSSPNGLLDQQTSTNPYIQPFFKIKPKSP
ncbi:hypothetical protein ACFX19_047759 [Malus domestica]